MKLTTSTLVALATFALTASLVSLEGAAQELRTPSPRTTEPPTGEPASPAFIVPQSTVGSPAAPGPGVALNQRIVRTAGCQDSEIGIGASRDGRNLVVASNGFGFNGDRFVSSQDFGANWSAPTSWPNGGGSTQGDPTVAFGQSGNGYLGFIWNNPAPSCDFGVSVSTNGGTTFGAPNSAVSCPPSANGCFPDQETMATDQLNVGGGGDQIYLAWRQFTDVGCPNPSSGNTDASIACSQDSAQNWTAPVLVDASGDRPRPAVAPDGSVYVVYVDGDGGAVRVHRFTSCSNGLAPIAGYPYTVTGSSSVTPVPNLDRQGQEGNPMIAVDPYNSELLYVVYGQDTAGSTSGDPGIFLRVSTDGGENWGGAIQVNDNVTNDTSRYFPWIAANPFDGSMNIGWYDRRDDPGDNDLTAYFGARATGGGTSSLAVSPNFRISDVDYLSSMPGSTCGSPIYGDYNAVAAGPSFMYAAWAAPVSPSYISPASADVDVFFAQIVSGDIPQIQASGPLDFGEVCIGSTGSADLNLCNAGKTDLVVNGISSSDPHFGVDPNVGFPLVISPDFCFPITMLFTPTSTTLAEADVTITSNDPLNPNLMVSASGNGTTPDIRLTGSPAFGDVCAEDPQEKTISVCNVGPCDLDVSSAQIDCGHFTIVNDPFPAVVSHDSCLDLAVAFTPLSAGPKSCTLTVISDDPDTPAATLELTGNTPFASIDVPAGQSFRPTVVQSVDVCEETHPFPVSNTGRCDLQITDLSISTNPTEYALSGVPSSPIILEPGHVAGDGALQTVFAPQSIDRDVEGAVSVTWIHDPITGATMSETRELCGEGARTGARVLVTRGGVPLDTVKSIRLQRINANRNNNRLDTVDTARNLSLISVTPNAPCAPFRYHREYGTVSNPIQLLPGSYQVTVQTRVDGRMRKRSVGFDVNSCGFNPTVIVDFE